MKNTKIPWYVIETWIDAGYFDKDPSLKEQLLTLGITLASEIIFLLFVYWTMT